MQEEGFALSPEDLDFFERLRRIVEEANRSMNLTRITAPEEFLKKHVADSILPFLRVPELRALGDGLLCADLGSGAGFPGFAIARVRPTWDVALIERTGKKAAFLEEAAALLGLDNVFVVPLDAAQAAAEVPLLRHRCDVVAARAVGRIAAVTRAAQKLVKPGGVIVHYKGGSPPADEIEEGAREAERAGFKQAAPFPYDLPPDERRSVVLVFNPPSGRRRGAGRRPTRGRRGRSGGKGR